MSIQNALDKLAATVNKVIDEREAALARAEKAEAHIERAQGYAEQSKAFQALAETQRVAALRDKDKAVAELSSALARAEKAEADLAPALMRMCDAEEALDEALARAEKAEAAIEHARMPKEKASPYKDESYRKLRYKFNLMRDENRDLNAELDSAQTVIDVAIVMRRTDVTSSGRPIALFDFDAALDAHLERYPR
jgi:chromosome segregation ATPase